MNKPTVTEGIGSYSLQWDEGITVDVTRVREHTSDGHVTGEIAVRFGMNGDAKLLHQAQFNFSSTTTRKTLEKTLKERQAKVDWYGVIEQTCYYVVEGMRKGEAPRLVSTANEYKRPEPLVSPIVLRDQPTILFGEGESAKSLFAIVLGLVMILPWKDNPLGLVAPSKVTVPLWLDWETNEDEFGWRLQRLCKGTGAGYIEVPYQRCALALADDLERVLKLVDEHKAGCVIVDSVAGAAGGDINTAETAIRLFTALRRLNTSSVLVAHTSKDENKRPTIFGSVFFHNYARQVWYMKRENADDEDNIRVGLFHKKHNNTRPSPPLGFTFHFDGDEGPISIERTNIHDSADFVKELSAGARILSLLREGALKPSTIAQELGMPEGTVRSTLRRLRDKDRVLALPEGMYGLPL
jgi:hypothetical protein